MIIKLGGGLEPLGPIGVYAYGCLHKLDFYFQMKLVHESGHYLMSDCSCFVEKGHYLSVFNFNNIAVL